MSRTLLRREALLDASIAVVVLAITLSAGPREQLHGFDALGVALASVTSLALVARRRAPLAVFAITAAASAALIGLGYADQPPGPIVVLYFLALTQEEARPRTWLTDAALASLFLLHLGAFEIAQHAGYPGVPPIPFTLLFWVGAWVAATGCASGASASPGSRSAHCAPSARRNGSVVSSSPRSVPASPATCTIPPATRST